jgi:hypothetical protein
MSRDRRKSLFVLLRQHSDNSLKYYFLLFPSGSPVVKKPEQSHMPLTCFGYGNGDHLVINLEIDIDECWKITM